MRRFTALSLAPERATVAGLEADVALSRLGVLVHYLDVGGIPVPQAPGLAAIVAGARALEPDDDALLRQVSPVLDSRYRTFTGPVP